MNYGELVQQIQDLGFSDESEIEDFGTIIPNCINRAVQEINLTVSPILATYEFEQDGTETDLLYYDINELTAEDGNPVFLEFADNPVMYGDTYYKKFTDFDIENNTTLVIDGSTSGKFKVFYKKAHTPFTVDTEDNAEIELPLRVHHLLPLLASYYVWLDDDQTKSVYYYNRYEALVTALQENDEKPRVKIHTDWGL
jgi:hypothetical protein